MVTQRNCILLSIHIMSLFSCYGMEHSEEQLLSLQVPKIEDRLGQKPAISPLPDQPREVIQRIAHKLDLQSMANFASCCNAINKQLNCKFAWMRYLHEDNRRPSLKKMKDYILYNEELINRCATITPDQVQEPAFKDLFKHPLADPDYFRIGKLYWDGVIFDATSYLNKPERKVAGDEKIAYEKAIGGGPRKLFFINMVEILCRTAQSTECIRFLLEQGADLNPPFYSSPLRIAIEAFDQGGAFAGNADRCIDITNIVLDSNAYRNPHRSPLSRVLEQLSTTKDAHLLLPYFLGKGLNPNEKNDNGATPLMRCAQHVSFCSGYSDFQSNKDYLFKNARLLIEAKADPSLRDNKKASLFDYLPDRFHQEFQTIIDEQK